MYFEANESSHHAIKFMLFDLSWRGGDISGLGLGSSNGYSPFQCNVAFLVQCNTWTDADLSSVKELKSEYFQLRKSIWKIVSANFWISIFAPNNVITRLSLTNKNSEANSELKT